MSKFRKKNVAQSPKIVPPQYWQRIPTRQPQKFQSFKSNGFDKLIEGILPNLDASKIFDKEPYP